MRSQTDDDETSMSGDENGEDGDDSRSSSSAIHPSTPAGDRQTFRFGSSRRTVFGSSSLPKEFVLRPEEGSTDADHPSLRVRARVNLRQQERFGPYQAKIRKDPSESSLRKGELSLPYESGIQSQWTYTKFWKNMQEKPFEQKITINGQRDSKVNSRQECLLSQSFWVLLLCFSSGSAGLQSAFKEKLDFAEKAECGGGGRKLTKVSDDHQRRIYLSLSLMSHKIKY